MLLTRVPSFGLGLLISGCRHLLLVKRIYQYGKIAYKHMLLE
jgi:hypothetical protein